MTTRILGGKGNRGRRSQKTSCRATTSRRPPTRYERSHTRKVNLCIIQDKEDILDQVVSFSDLSIQKQIASILSAYDDLIENNTRRIKILEGMAQMIYREWFVNFRFPGHENVKLVESELGPIPEGWTAKCVTDAVLVNPATKVPREGVKPFLPMGGLSTNSMLIANVALRAF